MGNSIISQLMSISTSFIPGSGITFGAILVVAGIIGALILVEKLIIASKPVGMSTFDWIGIIVIVILIIMKTMKN